MRKSWPFALVVIVVGGLAGLAIAGRPVPADTFVLDSSITVPLDASTTTASLPATTTTTAPPSTTTIAPTTTTHATTTSVIATIAPTTTDAPTTTEPAATTTISGPLPRDEVRLVIANGDGRFKLASTTADRIRPLGYIIDLGDAAQPVNATILYYRPGFDDEAEIVANDISVPGATIAALPTNAAITSSDANGDVIVVLGPDAPR
jgi:hypothetical protein